MAVWAVLQKQPQDPIACPPGSYTQTAVPAPLLLEDETNVVGTVSG